MLLMTARLMPEFAGGGLGRMLVQGVARDVARRGLRAVEAFGAHRRAATPTARPPSTAACCRPTTCWRSGSRPSVRTRVPAAATGREDDRVLEGGRRVRARAAAVLDAGAGAVPLTLLARLTTAPRRPSAAMAGMRMTPVGGSSAFGRYSRWTATSRPSATVSRNAGSTQPGAVVRRGQIADLDADRRHPGQPQHRPRLAVDAAVEQAGARDELALGEVGQPLADRRARFAGAVVVRWRCRWRAATATASTCRDSTRSAPTSLAKPARCSSRGAVVRAAGQPGRARPSAVSRPFEPGREVPGQVGLADAVGLDARGRRRRGRGRGRAACRAGSGPASATATRSRSSCGRPPTTRRPSWRSARSVSGPQMPSGDQAVVALEACAAPASVRQPEDAVGADQVVAELQQLRLQRGDVVAGEQRPWLVRQHPVAEAPAGAGQRGVGLRPDDAVDGDAAALLEVPDRELGGLVETPAAVRVGVVEQPERRRACGAPRRRRCQRRRGGVAASGTGLTDLSGSGERSWTAVPSVIVPQPGRMPQRGIKSAVSRRPTCDNGATARPPMPTRPPGSRAAAADVGCGISAQGM